MTLAPKGEAMAGATGDGGEGDGGARRVAAGLVRAFAFDLGDFTGECPPALPKGLFFARTGDCIDAPAPAAVLAVIGAVVVPSAAASMAV